MLNSVEREKIINLPNALTLLRMLGAPFLVYVIFSDFSHWFTGGVFLLFALTDLADGYIARNFGLRTKFGAKFDMLADRIFFTAAILAIVARLFIFPEAVIVNKFLFLLILSREIIALPIVSFMLFARSPFLKVKWIGKITTFTQGAAIASFLFGFSFTIYLIIIAALVGIIAGLTYWQDSLKILTKK
ncbi:MAG: CDP-alcohol phosphatidyltransferase family protein [Patescibacteria group bacterium]|nr:CDP-alcohol phosphatidyltransferase family protein [Patescibacteria group bacterium]